MDVEKLRKIGDLSKELKKHGFASSSDDALKQSEHICRASVIGDEVFEAKSPEQIHAEQEREDAMKEEKQEDTKAKIEVTSEHLERIEAAEENILRIFDKMNEMIKTINKFESYLELKADEIPKEKQTKIPEPAPEKSSPRSGNYKPNDVQIDKIFYYGNK